MSFDQMFYPPNPLRYETTAPSGESAAALLLQPLLAQAVGADSFPVSLTLDFSAALIEGQAVRVEAWVDRATRSLIFAHGRLFGQTGVLIASGSAVFRRAAPHSLLPERQS